MLRFDQAPTPAWRAAGARFLGEVYIVEGALHDLTLNRAFRGYIRVPAAGHAPRSMDRGRRLSHVRGAVRAVTTTDFDGRAFRRACGQFLTGVTIVTARDALDAPVGVTVNSFTSVSLDPPMVLVSLDKRLGSYQSFAGSASFAVHVLSTDAAHVSSRFARRGADRVRWTGVAQRSRERAGARGVPGAVRVQRGATGRRGRSTRC
jgi:hypothetical protein